MSNVLAIIHKKYGVHKIMALIKYKNSFTLSEEAVDCLSFYRFNLTLIQKYKIVRAGTVEIVDFDGISQYCLIKAKLLEQLQELITC